MRNKDLGNDRETANPGALAALQGPGDEQAGKPPMVSIIVPAFNVANSLPAILDSLISLRSNGEVEIIVVDDASNDQTAAVASSFPVTLIRHPYNKGLGAALETGRRQARSDLVILFDLDEQHRPEDIELLLGKPDKFDLVMGPRTKQSSQVIKLISVIIPAKNEERGLAVTLPRLRQELPDAEIIVIDDGSTDKTVKVCETNQVKFVSHPYSMGNGAAIKTGARAARGNILIFMDADGQHEPGDIPKLLAKLDEGFDMAVGARSAKTHANIARLSANMVYNRLASWMVGHRIDDLTSGFRAVAATKFKEFLDLLPNGFSYPTTVTMSFFRAGYPVGYVSIHAGTRLGKSHINPIRDPMRFLLTIFKIGTLYSPLRLFVRISIVFALIGLSYYGYTLTSIGRFTNMSALLLTTSVVVFLIGLVSEQITNLLYSKWK